MRWGGRGEGGSRAGEPPTLGSFCSSQVAKLKIRDEAASKNKTVTFDDNMKSKPEVCECDVLNFSFLHSESTRCSAGNT